MHGWQSESTDGPNRKVVGVVLCGVAAMISLTTPGCSVV